MEKTTLTHLTNQYFHSPVAGIIYTQALIMYSEKPTTDLLLFIKAIISNQIARFTPSIYVKLTQQTGRGREMESHEETADYFFRCFSDYFQQIGVDKTEYYSFLKNKTILEYGPGDTLGVALLLYAYGAKSIHCIDRFPLSGDSEKSSEIYSALLSLLDKKAFKRASNAFIETGNPRSGFKPELISYSIKNNGISGDIKKYDLILSRAVLEHVNDLENTILDIRNALKPGGNSIHKVDLKSHGLDRYHDFDFLSWPVFMYNLMYSHKGFPNRWRVNKYLEIIQESGLQLKSITPTGKLDNKDIDRIKMKLSKPFKNIPTEKLSWLGFWIVVERI